MNTETLAKHQWLYEQGFEPDMAYVTHISGTSESSWEDWGLVEWYKDCKNPYFTESRLWSLLGTIRTTFCIYDYKDMHVKLLDQVIKEVKEGHLKAEGKQDCTCPDCLKIIKGGNCDCNKKVKQ